MFLDVVALMPVFFCYNRSFCDTKKSKDNQMDKNEIINNADNIDSAQILSLSLSLS